MYDEYKRKGLSQRVEKIISGECEDNSGTKSSMINPLLTCSQAYMSLDPKIRIILAILLAVMNFLVGFFIDAGYVLIFLGATCSPFILFVIPGILYY